MLLTSHVPPSCAPGGLTGERFLDLLEGLSKFLTVIQCVLYNADVLCSRTACAAWLSPWVCQQYHEQLRRYHDLTVWGECQWFCGCSNLLILVSSQVPVRCYTTRINKFQCNCSVKKVLYVILAVFSAGSLYRKYSEWGIWFQVLQGCILCVILSDVDLEFLLITTVL